MSTFEQFVDSIARLEGFYVPRSRAKRNNNPGNLRSWGRNKIVAGYAYFASVDDGDDFILAHLQPVAEFDRVDHSEIHVYLGSHPQRLSPASKTVAGTLLGRPVAWREDAPFKGILQQRCQQPLPDGRGTLDVFVDGPSKERIAALQAIAETLAVP